MPIYNISLVNKKMKRLMSSVLLAGLLLFSHSVGLAEGETVEYSGEAIEIPDYFGVLGYYPVVVEVPDDSCKKRIRDIVVPSTGECPSTPVVTYVKLPTGA